MESSKWLHHVSGVLDGAAVVVRCIEVLATNVVIHCSDGWDRSSQLAALAQVRDLGVALFGYEIANHESSRPPPPLRCFFFAVCS